MRLVISSSSMNRPKGDMLRAAASHLPNSSYHLTSPQPILSNNKATIVSRLSLFSSLSHSCSSSSRHPCVLPPSLSVLPHIPSLSITPSAPRRWWAPPTERVNTMTKGRVSFSTGNNGGGGKERLVQHLLVSEDDLKLLVELQQRIAGGEDLSDLAVEYSVCPSKEEGGMLGWVRKGQMVPEFEEAAFNAPLNDVVRCKTKFGWHLLQVLSEREESLLQDIEPKELHEKMQEPTFFEEVQLIDVREPDEVAQASLPGFRILSLRQFGCWGTEITNEFDPQKDTYVMCHHGMRSLQVAKWLQTQGFRRVFNVAGGIHAYAVKVDPSVPTY